MFLLATTVMICPNCGHEFVKEAPDSVTGIKTVMLEEKAATISALAGRRLSELTAIELAQWAVASGKKNHAIRVAKAMEQTSDNYLDTFAKAMGYKKGWAMYHTPAVDEKIDFYDKIIS